VDGSIRITEQGEVLAERYDDPHIAHRHLEQMTWATILVTALPEPAIKEPWLRTMDEIADHAYRSYRALVQTPGFADVFVLTTPIEHIEQLPIASRPSRRAGKRTLQDLRAIPWVFSWTQNRAIIPAWFGLGSAIDAFIAGQPHRLDALRGMYRDWLFFRATLDNAALALVKADMGIAQAYARLADEHENARPVWDAIAREHARSAAAVLQITGLPDLLADTPWMGQSLSQRNPLVDPLNLIQVELLRRRRAAEDPNPELDELLRLSIQGIAAGMRTTG
jgi:phosphoenolpyruvate carboxylase